MKNKKFIYFDSLGKPWGIASAELLWAQVYAIKYNKPEIRLEEERWFELLSQAKNAAIEFKAESLRSRIRLDYEAESFKKLFSLLDFQKDAGRIEYQCEAEKLPTEEGTPFLWKTAAELGWRRDEIANFTKQVVSGALDVDPNEDVNDFIQDWLKHHELTSGMDCLGIGFYQNEAIALVVAQTNVKTGWATLSYLGLVPQARGQGLSKWVHRHGFQMMKSQGATLYHGGTHSENFAMRKLFEKHGCKVLYEMEDWSLQLKKEGLQ